MNVTELRAICQKGELENYLFDKYIFRKFSIYGTLLAIKLRLKPNFITLASLLCAVGSLYPLGTNNRILVVVGCVLIFLYNYLDHIDGELARFYHHNGAKSTGLSGQYFDVLCHSYSANLMLLFTGWASYSEHQQHWILLAGVGAMVGMNSFPNLVAAKVMMMKIASNPGFTDSPGMTSLFFELEKKKKQISDVNAPTFSARKILKIARETAGYPGILMIIIAANLWDVMTSPVLVGSIFLDGRNIALLFTCGIHIPYMFVRSRYWMRLLRNVN